MPPTLKINPKWIKYPYISKKWKTTGARYLLWVIGRWPLCFLKFSVFTSRAKRIQRLSSKMSVLV